MTLSSWRIASLVQCLGVAALAVSLCACSTGKPVRRAAAVGAAGAATGAVVKNQAKSAAKDQVAPNLGSSGRIDDNGRSIRD